MAFFSAIYICATVGFYRLGLGDAALVYANIVNLTARIVYVIIYTSSFFKSKQAVLKWFDAIPSFLLITATITSTAIIYGQREYLHVPAPGPNFDLLDKRFLVHFGSGAVLGIICLSVWWATQGRSAVKSMLKRGEKAKKE
jgi:oligosaccharide translocation protein RFT1